MPPSKRLAFIDLLRGWAVIVMIETHVVNATMSLDAAASEFFPVLAFINGLVAPSFLFASGMAYAVTTRRKLPSYLSFGRPLFRQLWRLTFILLLAYMLHLPVFNLRQMLGGVHEQQWLNFFQSDVLHCIAVSLLFLQVLLLAVRSERSLYRVAGAVAVLMLFLTPLMWSVEWLEYVPAPLAAYLNGRHFSLFPLFPWAVFLFAGAIAGYFFAETREKETSPSAAGSVFPWRPFAIAGGIMVVLSFVLLPLGALYPTYDYWRYSPSFVMLRLGVVVALCAMMMRYEERKTVSPRSIVTLIGRESLLVYTTHLLLIYGNFGSFNFRRWANHSFTIPEAFEWALLLFGLMVLLAFFWDWVRRRPPLWKQSIQWATLAAFIAVFVFGPGE